MKAAQSCYAQAKGEAVVSSVQLPTGDESDWLCTEPDIDEAAITETVDTDIPVSYTHLPAAFSGVQHAAEHGRCR